MHSPYLSVSAWFRVVLFAFSITASERTGFSQTPAPIYVVSHLAGSLSGPGKTDGTGAAAQFSFPSGVAADSAGNIYVADTLNNAVRKITAGGVVTTLVGVASEPDWIDGPLADARLEYPQAVAVDSQGNVYVTELAGRVRKIATDGVVSTLAGSTPGYADGPGNLAQFAGPTGLAVDSGGYLFVADSPNAVIRKITPAGVVSTLAGSAGQIGSVNDAGPAARFIQPRGIAVDSSGVIYVADGTTIRKVTSNGVVTTLAGADGQSSDTDGTGNAARFELPSSLTVDSAGNVYVTDLVSSKIRKITSGGVVTTIAGSTVGSSDGVGSGASFWSPSGITVDNAGILYVADTANSIIRKVTSAGSVSTYAGTGPQEGSTNGIGTAARFYQPDDVAVDSDGTVYVADNANFIVRKITAAGAVSTLAGQPGQSGSTDGTGSAALFASVSGITVDSTGNIYVIDSGNYLLRKITPQGVVTTVAGSPVQGTSVDGIGSSARFAEPSRVAIDAQGTLYVSDLGTSTIRKITSTGVVTTIAGMAAQVGSSDGVGSAARFNGPQGIAVDISGNIYVADCYNDTIRKITPAGAVTTLAGNPGVFGSCDGQGASALFRMPQALTVDQAGNVYVADGTGLIRKITSTGMVSTLLGAVDIVGNIDGQGSQARFAHPLGLAVDTSGALFIADTYNNAIRKAVPVAPTINWLTPTAITYGNTLSDSQLNASSNLTGTFVYNPALDSNLNTGSQTLTVQFLPDGAPIGYTAPSTSVSLSVNQATPSISWPPPAAILTGTALSSIQLNATANVPGSFAYSPQAGEVLGLSANQILSVTFTPTDQTNYKSATASNTITVNSQSTIVVPPPPVAPSSRLLNISTRSFVSTGANVQIAGFIITGSTPQTVLIRANGPALQKSGITTGLLADPTLALHNTDATQSVITTNDNWGDDPTAKATVLAAVAATKAPAWDDGSKDAAIVATLSPGGYTAVVTGKGGTSGIALIEVFVIDLSANSSKLSNISTRSSVGSGANVQIAGFIITGNSPKKVVIRANGPALTKFGLPTALADPKIELHSSAAGQPVIATNDNWDAASQQSVFKIIGIDNWEVGSKDAAIITTLDPGGYTAIVSGVGGTSGISLVEVFDAD